MNDTTVPVAVIGLGLMGQALARAFLRAGHPTTVWNRTAAKAEPLVAEGARLAPTPEAAFTAASLTVVCVTDHAVVRDLLAPGADLGATTVVNLTSSSSGQAREAAGWARARGAAYLDGAVMAVPPAIGTADAVLLLSGPAEDFAAHQGALAALGTLNHLGEDDGLAALYDVAGLTMMWAVLNAWLHGTAMLETAGVPAGRFAPFAGHIATLVADWLPGYAEQVDNGAYPARVSALETDAHALAHLVAESAAVGVNTELPALFKRIADRGIAEGHGKEQYPVLIDQFRAG